MQIPHSSINLCAVHAQMKSCRINMRTTAQISNRKAFAKRGNDRISALAQTHASRSHEQNRKKDGVNKFTHTETTHRKK